MSTPPLNNPDMTNVPRDPHWTDAELRTLVRFRRRVGRRWKSQLLDLYLFGKDDNEPEGPGLRHIRNRQGPSRVHALRTAVLDAAERRFADEPEQAS